MNILSSHRCNWSQRIQEHSFKGKPKKVRGIRYLPANRSSGFHSHQLVTSSSRSAKKHWQVFSTSKDEGLDPSEGELGDGKPPEEGFDGVSNTNLYCILEAYVLLRPIGRYQ